MKIVATRRVHTGKEENRRLRARNMIPAVAYGRKLQSQNLAVSPKRLTEILTGPRGKNTVVELEIEGETRITALICDYQYHPVSRALLHADFLEVAPDRNVDVEVLLVVEGRAKGIVMGGKLRQMFRSLPVSCRPGDIPEKIVIDITNLGLDETLTVADLKLAEGLSIRMPSTQRLVIIAGETKRADDAEEAAAAAAPDDKKKKK